MNRNQFGLWGLDLSQDDFAKALAALGMFQSTLEKWPATLSVADIKRSLSDAERGSSGLLGWKLNLIQPEGSAQLNRPGLARLFAQAWEEFRQSREGPRRFELYLDRMSDYFWIAEQLLSSAVGATSLYVRADEPEANIGWNWPLRIGFLGSDESQQLRSQLESSFAHSSLNQLVDFVKLEAEGDDCDLLLLPQGLNAALSEVLRESVRPRADCVLVLGGSKELSERAVALINALRAEARTGGVGLLFIPEERRLQWFYGLIAQLSHNNPLDVALFNVNREVESPPALLAASRRLIDLSLVSRVAERLSYTLEQRVVEGEPPVSFEIPVSPPISKDVRPRPKPGGAKGGSRRGGSKGGGGRVLRGGSKGGARKGGARKGGVSKDIDGSPPPSDESFKITDEGSSSAIAKAKTLGLDLRRAYSDSDWGHESDAATEIARKSRDARSVLEELPRKSAERRIQAQVFGYENARRGEQERRALRPNAPYVVDIFIGPPSKERETADEAFPVDKLPPSEKGHQLTVVFSEPNVAPEPQVEKLFLPPEGSTDPCSFYFHTRPELKAIKARIIVLHRNRIIQTAILEAPVAASGVTAKEKVNLYIEARVLPNINDLQRRQKFDAALVLNHTDDGRPLATAMTDERAMMFSLNETALSDTIQTLNGELTNLADDPDSYPEDIGAEPTTKLLNMLARHGRVLYKHLFVLRPEGQWLVDKSKKRIQIVSTRRASNLPLEFLYDYAAPNMDAKLCGYAKQSLPTGQCNKACEGPKNNKAVVCPLGFWGLNRVIERHAYDESISSKGDYALRSNPSANRVGTIRILDKALFAASAEVDRAKKGTIKKVTTMLKAKTNHTDYVVNWDDWVKKIKTQSPSLLLLLSHTEEDTEDKLPALEISKLQRLSKADIEEWHVRNPDGETRPVVMLIGCKTGAPDNKLHDFVASFGAYASIVLSTGATILAIQAAQVAIEFVQALSNLSETSNATFGDAMLDLRRRLLAKGLPMVLCLSAYGDADWYLK